jgi:hypothetical protein
MRVESGQHLGRVGHAGKVRADIDRVRSQKRERCEDDNRARKLATKRRAQALAGNQADARAHELHRRHQRPGDERRPEKRSAKLRACD